MTDPRSSVLFAPGTMWQETPIWPVVRLKNPHVALLTKAIEGVPVAVRPFPRHRRKLAGGTRTVWSQQY